LLTNVIALFGPWALKTAIDSLMETNSGVYLARYALIIVTLALLEGIFRFLMRKTIIGVSRHIEYELRNDFFSHIQSLSQTFYNRHKTGDLMALATNDLEAVRQMVGPAIMYSLNTFFSMAYFVVMLLIDAKLALLALAPFPFMAVMVYQMARRLNKAHRQIQDQYAAITSKAQESLSGIRIVKCYVQEQGEIAEFEALNRDFIDKNLAMVKTRGLMSAMMGLLMGLGGLIILWLGGKKVIEGTLTLGELVAFFSYLGMLTWPMIAAGWVINLFQQGAASMARLNRVFEIEPDIEDGGSADFAINKIAGEIEFKDVSFSYGDVDVLKNINLRIKRGMTLAIVGPTGSGKSTLINLIPRLREVTSGEILIDGRCINDIPLSVLRQAIGYVPQDTFLFSDTISSNISFGVDPVTTAQIEEAAENSQIRRDITSFPNGFDTMLGERGINLSGGQKQRTSIARAIIRNPKILILDDSLSAVDTYTEDTILKRLRKIMAQRTSVIVSHRVSTVKDANLIIYIDNGQITERGAHDELIQLGGAYARLYQHQLLEEAIKAY